MFYNVQNIIQLISYNMDFKKYIQDKIQYFSAHFKRRAVLLQQNGQALFEIDLSFDHLSDQFMNKAQQLQSSAVQMQKSTMKLNQLSEGLIKINDQDLVPLWEHLDSSYKLAFNIQGQNITDETVLRISQLFRQGKCGFTALKFSGNQKVSQIGAVKLAEALRDNQSIKEIKFHGLKLGKYGANRIAQLIICSGVKNLDLGLIGDESLTYLATVLGSPHKLQNISFGQDQSDPWKKGKEIFQQVVRRGQYCKQLFSVNLYPQHTVRHWQLINQLNILCRKRRNLKVTERQNEFKVASLNPDHTKYYDPENHSLNAYKFSVKSYLTNVFGSDLDQALYFLQKQRRNSLREQAIFEITKAPINKIIMEDICTADGSILVLAKYLLGKIKQKKSAKEQA